MRSWLGLLGGHEGADGRVGLACCGVGDGGVRFSHVKSNVGWFVLLGACASAIGRAPVLPASCSPALHALGRRSSAAATTKPKTK